MKIVGTTSLPAVDRPNADRWNATHSCQLKIDLAMPNKNIGSPAATYDRVMPIYKDQNSHCIRKAPYGIQNRTNRQSNAFTATGCSADTRAKYLA